ncbi:MAG: M48 family metalloprotease [Asticcacaulis sp.]
MGGRTIEVPQARTPWGWGGGVEERYRPMIGQLEDYAQRHPGLYRWRVLGGALMGYAYLGAILIGLAVVIGLLVVAAFAAHLTFLLGKGVIILLAAGFYVLRALWVKFDKPKGVAVTAKQAPELFSALVHIRRETDGPKVGKVLLTEDFNAAIVQVPRLGIFGWHQNYLLLGLPLLMALSEGEVKAVVAHEYGHLAGAHGKMSAWVYRVRRTWARLSEAFESGGMAFMLKGFFRWYGPWFNAYSFVLARANEYEADRCSAKVAGSQTAASALARVSAEDYRYSAHWDTLYTHSRHSEKPETMPYTALGVRFAEPLAMADQQRVLKGALSQVTGMDDTHPCLSDRLRALGENLPELSPVVRSGAQALLGDVLTREMVARFDASWWQDRAATWEDNFRQAEELRARRRELDTLFQQGPLEEELYWERLNLIEYEGDVDTALSLAEAWAETHPDDMIVRRRVAQFYLERGEARGVDTMQAVLDTGDREQRRQGLHALAHYYGMHDAENPLRDKVIEQLIEAERFSQYVDDQFSRLPPDARLDAPDLSSETREALTQILASHYRIKSLWIARRCLPEDETVVQHVALFICRDRYTGMDVKDAFMDDLLRCLQPHGAALALENGPEREWLRKRMVQTEGAEVRRHSVTQG